MDGLILSAVSLIYLSTPATLTIGGAHASIHPPECGFTCILSWIKLGKCMIETPVQLSASGEHGFPIAPTGSKVRVTIDGDSRRAIVAYDIINNWVEAAMLDDLGYPLHKDGEYIYKREYGKVCALILD
jgi:hypothetical protein